MGQLDDESYSSRTISVLMRDGRSIDALIYTPRDAPWAAAVFAHGGAFASGTCKSNSTLLSTLARMKLATITCSFRQGPVSQYPSSFNDLADVTNFARSTLWPQLPIGIIGSSSGGFHALALSHEPPRNLPYAFCIAIAPVAHPGIRASYLQSCIKGLASKAGFKVSHPANVAAEILAMQTSYFGNDKLMKEVGDVLTTPGKHQRATRTLMILGSHDRNIPHQVTDEVQSWATKTIVLGGYGHEISLEPPKEAIDSYIPDLVQFAWDATRNFESYAPVHTDKCRL